MATIRQTGRLIRQAALCATSLALLFTLGLVGTRTADAGCGAYIHFRGSPSMAVNPVAKVEHTRFEKSQWTAIRGFVSLGYGQAGDRGLASNLPGGSPAGEGCHGPNCSQQRLPYLPQPIQVLLMHLPDGIVPSMEQGPDAPTAATLVAEHSSLPRRYSLGIFRPPRS